MADQEERMSREYLKLDIHVHTARTRTMPTPGWGKIFGLDHDETKYDEMGIEAGVILPGANPECSHSGQRRMEDIASLSGSKSLPILLRRNVMVPQKAE
jgi:hypothetical protein